MSKQDVERFSRTLEQDQGFAGKFASLVGNAEGWQALANEHGYELTLNEARELSSGVQKLSDEDLDAVAGGWSGDPGDPQCPSGSGSGTGGTSSTGGSTGGSGTTSSGG